MPLSDVYVRSFLYLFYTLIKLYYIKALNNQALSLASNWILLLRPRILVSFVIQQQPFSSPLLTWKFKQYNKNILLKIMIKSWLKLNKKLSHSYLWWDAIKRPVWFMKSFVQISYCSKINLFKNLKKENWRMFTFLRQCNCFGKFNLF